MNITIELLPPFAIVDGIDVQLTDQECAVLECLMEQAGHIVERDVIFSLVWPQFEPWPEPKILDVIICRIRKKIAQVNPRHSIETQRGVGYGFFPLGNHNEGIEQMGKTFHHKLMRKLDRATYNGQRIPDRIHEEMRATLRKSQMRGVTISSPRQLAKAMFDDMAKGGQ